MKISQDRVFTNRKTGDTQAMLRCKIGENHAECAERLRGLEDDEWDCTTGNSLMTVDDEQKPILLPK
jgi:hypothetical protein